MPTAFVDGRDLARALEALTNLASIMERRPAQVWPDSERIVLIVDEAHAAIADPTVAALAHRIARDGRRHGVVLAFKSTVSA